MILKCFKYRGICVWGNNYHKEYKLTLGNANVFCENLEIESDSAAIAVNLVPLVSGENLV